MPEEFDDVPYDDAQPAPPDFGGGEVKMMSFAKLRDISLNIFDVYMRQRVGLPVKFSPAELLTGNCGRTNQELEECRMLLSVSETEAIVRDLSIKAGNGLYAVGGNTLEEANEKISAVMAALCARIMSNLTAIGVREGLLDAAFDDEENDFTFRLTDKGRAFGEKVAEEYGLDIDKNGEEDETDDEC
jgi:hypothetical protein